MEISTADLLYEPVPFLSMEYNVAVSQNSSNMIGEIRNLFKAGGVKEGNGSDDIFTAAQAIIAAD